MKFNQNVLSGLHGMIPGGISISDFTMITKINDADSQKILDGYIKNGIGKKQEDKYYFEDSDKLKAGIELIKNGGPIDEIAIALNWKNFEGLVAEMLFSKDFAVIKNLILTKPRMEIDVIGIRLGIAMLVDCKHWKRYSYSTLSSAVKKQIERTKHYVLKTQGAIAVPVIVTLYQDKLDFINRVPIVPIFQFSSFIDEFYGHLDQMNTMETE